MRIIVTGANGFLGKHCIEELHKKSHQLYPFRIQDDVLGLEDQKIFQISDAIIHLAGINRDEPRSLYQTNTDLTFRLLQLIVKYNAKLKVVFASSSQVYDPQSVYGLSKRASEELGRLFVRKHGLSFTCLRFSNLYGPGGRPYYNSVITTFIEQIKKNHPITLNNQGKQKKDYLYVSDAVEAIRLTCESKLIGFDTFDICSGKLVSLNAIIKLIQKIETKQIQILNQTVLEDTSIKYKMSYHTAQTKLNWKPHWSLQDGLKNMINYGSNTT